MDSNFLPDLLEFTSEELDDFCIRALSQRPGRGRRVAAWLFRQNISDLNLMVDVNRRLRESLLQKARISRVEVCDRQTAADGTMKFLYRLEDGKTVEGVLIPGKNDRLTLCVSSQVGCAVGCAFCLTATSGLTRNLSVGEMTGQVLAARKLSGAQITNIVLMGQGEPLNNYAALKRFIAVASDMNGMAIPPRKITVSTSGLVPMIDRLGRETGASLAVSLNATTDEVRDRLIPVNKAYPIPMLMESIRRFCVNRKGRVLIEYVMLAGVNDSEADARRLLQLLEDIPCMVNLLPFNSFPGAAFERPDMDRVNSFWKVLQGSGITTIVRYSKGSEISAACGQLKTEVTARRTSG